MPSFISYDASLRQFIIKPSNPATDIGVFKVKGILSDSRLSSDFSFTVEVFNNPPSMNGNLADQTIFLSVPSIYTIPKIEDEEGLKIKERPVMPLPWFITYDVPTRSFKF